MKQLTFIAALVGVFGVLGPALDGDVTARTQNTDSAKHVYVIGYVESPGSYRFIGETMTVGQAIAVAGGLRPGVSDLQIRVVRMENGDRVEISVGLNDAIKPDDVVSVTRG